MCKEFISKNFKRGKPSSATSHSSPMKASSSSLRDSSLGNFPTMLKSFNGNKKRPVKANFLRLCGKARGGGRSKGPRNYKSLQRCHIFATPSNWEIVQRKTKYST